jgi:ribosome assembly protein RRB1
MCVVGDKPLAASWSETGKVFLWDLTHPLKAVNDPVLLKNYVENKESPRPLFTFKGKINVLTLTGFMGMIMTIS